MESKESKRFEYIVLFIILVIATGFRFYGLTDPIVWPFAGVLTVLGTYLLARRLFNNWEIAAISAFLMATGLWHVAVSRSGLEAVFSPLCAVWGLYYFYQGLLTPRIWPWLMAGVWLGLGLSVGTDTRLVPAVVVVTILAYLFALRNDFAHDTYAHIRQHIIGGMALMVAVLVLFFVPIASDFYTNAPVSVDTVALLAGLPIFNVFLAALFGVGILRTGYKILRTWRTHGHPSIVHVLLISWLAIGCVPGYLFVAAPAFYIIAGQGVWWLYVWFKHWYNQHDPRQSKAGLIVGFTLIVFLFAMGTLEANRYFILWTQSNTPAQELPR